MIFERNKDDKIFAGYSYSIILENKDPLDWVLKTGQNNPHVGRHTICHKLYMDKMSK